MSNYGLSLLEGLILDHPDLSESDKAVVSKLCGRLRIEDEPGLVNTYIQKQVDDEATATYLYCKYQSQCRSLESQTEKYRAEKSSALGYRNDEGLKWTRDGKEQYLLSFDAQHRALTDMLKQRESLLYVLKELHGMTFKRNNKLEQLSINYRREAEADR